MLIASVIYLLQIQNAISLSTEQLVLEVNLYESLSLLCRTHVQVTWSFHTFAGVYSGFLTAAYAVPSYSKTIDNLYEVVTAGRRGELIPLMNFQNSMDTMFKVGTSEKQS